MSIKGQGHSFTLVKVHSDFKVKCLTFGLYTQVSNSGPLGPLVLYRMVLLKIKLLINGMTLILICESFLDGDVPRLTSYDVYISQLFHFARVSSHVDDVNTRNKF